MSIQIKIDDLKRAIAAIEADSKEITLRVDIDGHQLTLGTFDRRDCEFEVVLFENGCDFLPKIRKTDILR
jgi:hypothetical protein